MASLSDLIGPIPSRSGNLTKNEDEGIAQLLTNAVNEFWGDRIDQWLDTILRGNVRDCVQDLKNLSEQIIFALILYWTIKSRPAIRIGVVGKILQNKTEYSAPPLQDKALLGQFNVNDT